MARGTRGARTPSKTGARRAPEEAEQPEPEPEDPRAAAGGSPADAGPSPGAPRRRRRARNERGSESTRYLSAWQRIHTRGKSLCAVLAKGGARARPKSSEGNPSPATATALLS